MSPEDFPVGTRVTYEDEDPVEPQCYGVVVEPTAEELRRALQASDPLGPTAGDVLVEWDGEHWDRAWNRPEDLQLLP